MTLRHTCCSLLVLSALCLPAGLFSPLTAPLSAQSVPDQLHTLTREELDIIKVLTRQEDNWNAGNLDAFATGYKNSPDILFIGHQISRGYDQMLADYKKGYPNKEAMGTLSFSGLEPHVLDQHYAVVLGHYRVDRSKKAGGLAEGIFSLVLEKTPDGWKIIVDHTTS